MTPISNPPETNHPRSIYYDSDEDVEETFRAAPLYAEVNGRGQGHSSGSMTEIRANGNASTSSEYLTAQSSSTSARKRKGKAIIAPKRAADKPFKQSILVENASHPSQRVYTKTRRTSILGGGDQRNGLGSFSWSWSGYDLSMMIALLSPIGNLLTGSDHIKNILLLFFLVYYLYQLVEVPWRLYLSSIPKQGLGTTLDASKQDSRQAPTKGTPHSQLRFLEYFYLLLTVLSPIAGAVLLKTVARTISGQPDSLSWFSTTLFVLAAGVRPWSHFVDRLHDRNRSLVTILEEELNDTAAIALQREAELDAELHKMREQVAAMEYKMGEAAELNAREVDDLVAFIETLETELKGLRTLLVDSSRAYDGRLDALEAYILALQQGRSSSSEHSKAVRMRMLAFPLLKLFWEMYTLPWTILIAAWARAWAPYSSLERSARPRLPQNNSIRQKRHSLTLETIAEENADSSVHQRAPSDDSDYTHVGDQIEWKFSRVVQDAVVPLVTMCLRPAVSAIQVIYFVAALPRSVLHLLCFL